MTNTEAGMRGIARVRWALLGVVAAAALTLLGSASVSASTSEEIKQCPGRGTEASWCLD